MVKTSYCIKFFRFRFVLHHEIQVEKKELSLSLSQEGKGKRDGICGWFDLKLPPHLSLSRKWKRCTFSFLFFFFASPVWWRSWHRLAYVEEWKAEFISGNTKRRIPCIMQAPPKKGLLSFVRPCVVFFGHLPLSRIFFFIFRRRSIFGKV